MRSDKISEEKRHKDDIKDSKIMSEKDLKRKKKAGGAEAKENEDLVTGTNSVKDFCLFRTPKGGKLR